MTKNRTARFAVSGVAVAAVVAGTLTGCSSSNSSGSDGLSGNRYAQVNLAASEAAYHAKFTDPAMIDAWGVAIRPKGLGGDFWVEGGGTSWEFIGDVTANKDAKYQTLFQGPLKRVFIPNADSEPGTTNVGRTTGVVFNPAQLDSDKFVVHDQPVTIKGVERHENGSARFIFATETGTISAWTENADFKHADGPAIKQFDGGDQGMNFKGIALTPDGNTLLAVDFGQDPQIRSFDSSWKLIPTNGFANPFATGDAIDPADAAKGKKVKVGDPAPWNVTTAGDKIFISYAKTRAAVNQPDATKIDAGGEAYADNATEADKNFKPDMGEVAEFDASGKLIRTLDDEGRFNAPWGVAMAPNDFGPLSGKLLVGNFHGAGRIQAFDPDTGKFVDYVRDAGGKPVEIDGLWGLLFGNGDTLGDANALYFTAGPDNEHAGLFGSLRLKQ